MNPPNTPTCQPRGQGMGWALWIQYIPRNMHTVFALLCFVVVIHRLIFPYPSGLLHWHCGNLTIAPVPAKQPWWICINTSCEFIMNDCITTTKQSTTKPCAYFLGYTVEWCHCSMVGFIKTCQKKHPIACPLGQRGFGCCLWLQEVWCVVCDYKFYVMPQQLKCRLKCHAIMEPVITAPVFSRKLTMMK